MDIDISRAKAFAYCPAFYYEKYIKGIQKDWGEGGQKTGLGTRMHQLLEHHYRTNIAGLDMYPPSEVEAIEDEAQEAFAAYQAHYPTEPFRVIEVERTFKLPLISEYERCEPCRGYGSYQEPSNETCDICKGIGFIETPKHNIIGKIDGIIQYLDTGKYAIFEHKTETRGRKDNTVEAWATKMQVSAYLYAGQQLYPQAEWEDVLLNVITRRSEKQRVGVSFPERQHLQRSQDQIREALDNLIYIADQIEALDSDGDYGGFQVWPTLGKLEGCKNGFWTCEFYGPHLYGWTDEFKNQFIKVEDYLGL